MITGVSSITDVPQSGALAQVGGQDLGRDAFLKLLVTQIQMQDPLEPLSAREYVAQLAQFSTVEQVQDANVRLAILYQVQAVCQALLLIGRSIATADESVTGVVEAVSFTDGQPKLIVGDQEVDPGDVARVW